MIDRLSKAYEDRTLNILLIASMLAGVAIGMLVTAVILAVCGV